jgi:hypothetical protein
MGQTVVSRTASTASFGGTSGAVVLTNRAGAVMEPKNLALPLVLRARLIAPKTLRRPLKPLAHLLHKEPSKNAVDFHSTQQPKASVDDPWLSHSAAAGCNM